METVQVHMMNLVQVQDQQQYMGQVLQLLFRDSIQSHNHDRVLLLLQKIKSLLALVLIRHPSIEE